jgi:hypothetical protein
MAKQTLSIGAFANDGTGTNLRAGGTIVNANFNEIYTALGNGTTITLTATPTELNLLAGATSIVTSNNSVVLSNKTISGSNNTLSNIGNSSLTNSSFSIRDDSSSAISISLGGTLKLKSNDGITTTVSQGDTITIGLDSNIVTETSSDVLTNKSISASTNTITNLTNTNLSGTAGITNANIQNSFIRITDETSTVGTVNLGDRLDFLTGNGIDTVVAGNTVRISTSAIPNSSLSNSTVLIGGNTITLGAAATTSISNLNLSGTSSLSGTGTIDLTSSGNKLRFNFANSGALPAAATYAGMFATTTGTAKAFFADSGGWNEIASENSSINLFSDVDLTTQAPADQQGLVWVSSSGKFVPGTGDLIKTAALIDVTNSGSGAYLFNSHYSGNNPTLYFRPGQTYAFRLNVTGHPFHLQTVAGGYSSGNAYTTGLTHVSLTGAVTTGASALLKVTGILYYEVPSNTSTSIFYACQFHSAMAGKIVIGNITETATGDGSTTTLTINSGRNVNDLLVFVNGICLEPTSDYTISGTTLTFVTAPVSAATITIRYL